MASNDVELVRRPVDMRAIPGFEGRYSITCYGRVWSHGSGKTHKKPYWKASWPQSDGYLSVHLYKGGDHTFLVHRLVMFAWGTPKPSPLHEINHRDGNKLNNHISNLEWVTPTQNTHHAIALGLRKNYGERHRTAKLTEAAVVEIRHRYANGATQMTLAKEYGVNFSTIFAIVKRQTWKHLLNT